MNARILNYTLLKRSDTAGDVRDSMPGLVWRRGACDSVRCVAGVE